MSDWIAVVDDDRTILGLASRILGAKNMRVSCLKSGVELLEFLEENRPDLILLDIRMPDMDGLETIAVIKSRPQIAARRRRGGCSQARWISSKNRSCRRY